MRQFSSKTTVESNSTVTLRLRKKSQEKRKKSKNDNEQNDDQSNSVRNDDRVVDNDIQLRVSFTPDTIDNEHHGKKKSKCCCIFKMGKDKSKNKYER